jgi:hypothetical protein
MQSFSDRDPNCFAGGRLGESSRLIDEQSSGKSCRPQRLQFHPINKHRGRSFQPEGHGMIVIDPVKIHLCLDLFAKQCKSDVFSQVFFCSATGRQITVNFHDGDLLINAVNMHGLVIISFPPPPAGGFANFFLFYFLIKSDEEIKHRPEHRYCNGKEPDKFINIFFKFVPEYVN